MQRFVYHPGSLMADGSFDCWPLLQGEEVPEGHVVLVPEEPGKDSQYDNPLRDALKSNQELARCLSIEQVKNEKLELQLEVALRDLHDTNS